MKNISMNAGLPPAYFLLVITCPWLQDSYFFLLALQIQLCSFWMLLISSIVQCFHFCWGHNEFVMHKCSTIYFPSDYVGSRNGIVQGKCSAPHDLITKIIKFSPPLIAFHKSTWWWCHKSISLLMQVSTSRLMCTLVMRCVFGLWYI